MASIPIVSGIYTDAGPDVRTAYPVNMMPVPKGSGVSESYLRPHDGVVRLGDAVAPGLDRGGINWRDTCYRVMGTKLVSVAPNGAITVLGDVGFGGYVTMDYSFDDLAIVSGGNVFIWNGATLTQANYASFGITIGPVLDLCFMFGRYMLTDGERLFCTELGNPLGMNPFAFEEPIADPDPVSALIRLRNEAYAINRYTIEVYDTVGGNAPFPFAVIDGAQVQKGCVGTFACCNFDETIAFLGSGRNESPSIYMAANATATPIATQDIDELLQSYTEAQLAQVKLEARIDRSHKLLYVHLPDRTVVYDHAASEALQQRVWFTLIDGVAETAPYSARNIVWCYDKWLVGSVNPFPTDVILATESGDDITTESGDDLLADVALASLVGYFDQRISTQWDAKTRWEFSTPIVYNESRGAIFQEMELVSLTGRVAVGTNPQITTSYSLDGVTWSQDQTISIGTTGSRLKRLVWWRQGFMRDRRIQRFRGDSDAHLSVLRLEARLEPLSV